MPAPTHELIVMSTFDGDASAILESVDALAGMYIHDYTANYHRRVKININSGAVTLLTKEEIDEIPVGSKRPITKAFRVKRVKKV